MEEGSRAPLVAVLVLPCQQRRGLLLYFMYCSVIPWQLSWRCHVQILTALISRDPASRTLPGPLYTVPPTRDSIHREFHRASCYSTSPSDSRTST
ncbi:hypothetical protein EJ03DRAFT_17013 [Teratosphaeria nubilosa]|uniref:Uncharacterized protein n=1 Tax=Teratosphaeria nubilosa TaxID=161662 RepID=A0A6G1KWQ2_9PEZI|nr:hypothetical protein EJ03DRAFT_17013 [Teratosphaeria nubilosa]